MIAAPQQGMIAAGIAIAATLATVPLARKIAVRFDITDKPGAPGTRKSQAAPVPLLGGLGVVVAAICAVLATAGLLDGGLELSFRGCGAVYLAGGIMFVIGLVDDAFKDKVGPLPKFLGQLFAIVLLFGERIAEVARGHGSIGDVFYLAATTLWFLTVVNAVNFVDNMNGLCPGLSMLSFLVGLFGLTGDADVRYARIAGALGGAFLGFLPYNYPKARIYLGDAGSHVAGFFLAVVTLDFTSGFLSAGAKFYGLDAFVPPMLLLGIPLFDILFSVVNRWREKRPLFTGDARHLSHRLVGAGLDPASAVMLLWGVHLILTAWGVVALSQKPAARYGMIAVILAFMALLSSILVRVESRKSLTRSDRHGR